MDTLTQGSICRRCSVECSPYVILHMWLFVCNLIPHLLYLPFIKIDHWLIFWWLTSLLAAVRLLLESAVRTCTHHLSHLSSSLDWDSLELDKIIIFRRSCCFFSEKLKEFSSRIVLFSCCLFLAANSVLRHFNRCWISAFHRAQWQSGHLQERQKFSF